MNLYSYMHKTILFLTNEENLDFEKFYFWISTNSIFENPNKYGGCRDVFIK